MADQNEGTPGGVEPVNNRVLPRARTRKGGFIMENEADRYGALYEFVRNLSTCGGIRNPSQVQIDAQNMLAKVNQTTYVVRVDYLRTPEGKDYGVRVERQRETETIEVVEPRPVRHLSHVIDVAMDRIAEERKGEGVEFKSAAVVGVR